jgi:photosystem II stability/assembly factor-like uncharacterized protein
MKYFYPTLLLLIILSLCSSVFSQNFWEQTSGPLGGTVLSIDKNSTGKIFVGTRRDLVFMGENNGLNWTQSDSGFINPYFTPSIDVIAINDNDHIFVAGYGTGVFRSLDNGQSWEQLSNGMHRHDIFGLAIDQNGFIYAGVSDVGWADILRSTDNGNSWEEKSNGLSNHANPMAFAIDDSNHIYTSTFLGDVYYTADQGENWIPILNTNNILLSIAISDENYIFAGGWNDKIYRSYDGGNSWDTLGVTNDPNQKIQSINADVSGYVFAGTDSDPRFTKGTFKSSDNGENWTAVNNGLTDLSIASLFVDSESNLYAGTFYGSLFKSTDLGINWNQMGPVISKVNDLIVDENDIIFTGTENEVYRSTNYGASWEYSSDGITGIGIQSLAYNNNGDIWVGARNYSGGIFRSTDKGLTWECGAFNIIPNSIHCDDSGYVYVSSFNDLYRTTDNGINWSILNSPNGVLLFITSDQTFYLGGTRLFRSVDRGYNWIEIFDEHITSVYVDDIGNIFAGNDGEYGGLFRSTDSGTSWESIDNGFISKRIRAINGKENSGIYCSVGYLSRHSQFTYYVSYDNGDSWSELNLGITSAGSSLEFDSNGFLYAGTTNRGVFRSVETTSSIQAKNNVPSTYFLSQNYPNPFNPSTTIRFTITDFRFTTLKVYDVLGNEVATLVNEEKPTGNYEVEWEATGLPSGIYFYRLQAGSFVETKKMVLIK